MFISELIDYNPYVVVNLKTKEPRMKDGKIKQYANAGIARSVCSQIVRSTGNNNWDFMPASEFEDLKSEGNKDNRTALEKLYMSYGFSKMQAFNTAWKYKDASPEEVKAWLERKKKRFNSDTNDFGLEETTKKIKRKNKNGIQWVPVDTIEHPAGTRYSPKNKYIDNPDYNTRDEFNKKTNKDN